MFLFTGTFHNRRGGSTPPPADPHFANVVLLCGFDGTDGATSAVDDSPVGNTITFAGNAQLDTADKVFGTASLLLDGSGDYVQIPHINFGSDPFTIEFRYQPLSLTTNHNLVCQWIEPGDQLSFILQVGHAQVGDGIYLHYSTTGANNVQNSVTQSWSVGQKYAMCLDWDGANFRVYRDGAMVLKVAFAGTIFNSTAPFQIGARNGASATNPAHARFDEIRVTAGVARYASDASFTVPMAAFPRA